MLERDGYVIGRPRKIPIAFPSGPLRQTKDHTIAWWNRISPGHVTGTWLVQIHFFDDGFNKILSGFSIIGVKEKHYKIDIS